MNRIFRINVPFIAVNRETLTCSMTSRLPPGETNLPDMLVHDSGDGHYTATIEVESPTPPVAKSIGIKTVEQFLKILAVSGDLFEVDISSVNADFVRDINPTGPTITQEGNTVHLSISDTVFVSAHLGLVKKKENVEFEYKALANLERWPIHLRRGIDLNYSAVRTATDDIRFFLLASALEVLAWKKLGPQETLLKSALSPKTYEIFGSKLREFLKLLDLDRDAITKLNNRLLTTSKESVAQHLIDYLKSIGIDEYKVSEAADWWQMRSKIAHGESTSDDELRQALDRITQAVRSALRMELNAM